ncbi:MAG: enoyl-CoA hydratase/isomerase family protein [Chloroflexi bacterium]|nr:enoyl-CoA hydratase/isomerase family protein [Chloroflexota bacterium]
MTDDAGAAGEAGEAAVLVQVDGHVARITLNRPQAMNALDTAARGLLLAAMARVHDDPAIHVGILTGAGGRAFSAGADLKEWAQPGSAGFSGGSVAEALSKEPADEFFTIRVAKPLIAAIDGYCLAGGLELALACDLRIATPTSTFGLPEVQRGFPPGGGGVQRLVRAIALAPAMEMLLTGERIDAETALRWGLVSRVVPREELLPTAEALAARIAQNAPLATRAVKELALASPDQTLQQALQLGGVLRWIVGQTPEAQEGPRAFARGDG